MINLKHDYVTMETGKLMQLGLAILDSLYKNEYEKTQNEHSLL